MRTVRPLLLVTTLTLGASCALLARTYRPPRAPESEAKKVKFPWGTPRERVILSGTWLRAATMALDDFVPPEEAERARGEGEEAECLAQRDNYVVWAWVWPPQDDGGMDGGSPDSDGGSSSSSDADAGIEPDAGYSEAGYGYSDAGYHDAFDQPGMPKSPPIVYVSVFLLPGRCDLGGSPLMDMGAVYAIDTVNWRILAIHH